MLAQGRVSTIFLRHARQITLSIPTDICHSCIGYHTVVSEMTLLFTRGILTKFVCLAPSHDNGLKGS